MQVVLVVCEIEIWNHLEQLQWCLKSYELNWKNLHKTINEVSVKITYVNLSWTDAKISVDHGLSFPCFVVAHIPRKHPQAQETRKGLSFLRFLFPLIIFFSFKCKFKILQINNKNIGKK